MFEIVLYSFSKIKESYLKTAIQEYRQKIAYEIKLSLQLIRKDILLSKLQEKKELFYSCDCDGTPLSSIEFSHQLYTNLHKHKKINFIIGDAYGIEPSILCNTTLISLSPLTFTYQMTHLILLEQIYRAQQIYHNTPYHK